VNQFNAGMLILRAVFGLFFAYHGYNKFFGPGGLTGTTGWFDSIGMRWPAWQARLAAINYNDRRRGGKSYVRISYLCHDAFSLGR